MNPRPPSQSALLLSRDLFFTSKVTGTAAAMGLTVEVVGDAEVAVEKLRSGGYRCLFLDLGHATVNVGELMARLPSENRPPVIAFGAHVATARLEEARAAGCNEVLPRGRFAATLPDLLQKYIAGRP